MMHWKKGMALLIAFVMTGTLVTGCASQNNPTTNSTQPTAETLVQTSPVKFYCRTNVGKESMPDNQKVLDYIEQQSGIKLEISAISNEGYTEKIDLMIAAGDVFDGFSLVGYGQNYASLIEKDAIIPLNTLLDQYGPNVKKVMADAIKMVGTDKDGKIWTLPRAEKFPEGYVPTIREDWLKKLNMQMPGTMPELEAYLQAVKTTDLNGNGQKDEIPFLGDNFLYGMSNFTPYFFGSAVSTFGADSRYMDTNGTIWPIYSHPNFKAMLTMFRDWYKKGYLHKEANVLKTTQVADLKMANTVGMTGGWYSTGVTADIAISGTNPGAKYVPIPPLKDALVTPAWPSNPTYGTQIVVMKTSKNAAFLIKYFDWMLASPKNLAVAQYGLEGVHWNWSDQGKNELQPVAGSAEKYSSYYSLGNLYYGDSIMPLQKITPEDKKNYEYDVMQKKIKGEFKMLYPFDSQISYTTVGTPAENLTADGYTLIQESITKIVLGTQSIDDWDKVIANYMKIEGNIRSQVWTKQYNAYMGK